MRKLALNDFRDYTFLSNLKTAPSGELSVLVASKSNRKNGYDSHLYLNRGDEITRLTATGKEKLFLWDDDDTVLFACDRDPDLAKRREEGVELTSFHRISVHGGEAAEAFTLPVNVSGIQRITDGLYAVTATVDSERTYFTPVDPEKTPEDVAKRKKEREQWKILDEVPFWANGGGFTNKLRTRLFLYREGENTLTPITKPLTDVEIFRVAPCQKYIGYTTSEFKSGVKGRFQEVWLYDIEQDKNTRLLEDRFEISDMEYWDDKLILAATEAKNYGGNENPCFWVLSARTMELTYLADWDNWLGTAVGSDCRLGGGTTYKVHGDALYFTAAVENTGDLFLLDLPTGAIQRVTGAAGSIDCFDVGPQGIKAVAFLEDRLQELYAVEGESYRRLSSFNSWVTAEISYSKPRHHSFIEGEGYTIDGWVIPPVDYKEGGKYPCILHIHGGPKTIQGDVYFHEMQLWAAQGYFVLYCNPRGSDGKGNAFADIRGKYGTCDYDNIMQFLDEMLALYPAIDQDRLGVTGGSYGGFMTNWIIGHTDRFKAAASQRSISNWISKANTTDIGYFFAEDQNQANTWDSHDKLWWHSPLKYADKCTTPTLFIHSDNDYRCWVAEGYQMFTALRLHGVEARMCLFHGETHELSRSGKPDGRQKRMEEILGWMDRYLK